MMRGRVVVLSTEGEHGVEVRRRQFEGGAAAGAWELWAAGEEGGSGDGEFCSFSFSIRRTSSPPPAPRFKRL